MTFRVFHADVTKSRFGFLDTTFPADFTHVADVEAEHKGYVFQLTNHVDEAWPTNEGVTIPAGVDPQSLRSTSVGDVIQAGVLFYVVAPLGFERVTAIGASFVIPAISAL